MPIRPLPLALAILLIGATAPSASAQWIARPAATFPTATPPSFRGLSVLTPDTVWVSGSQGTFLYTTDGGTTWRTSQVSGAESFDFRDIHAVSLDTVYLMAAGQDTARIYKTTDRGQSWTLQYNDTRTGVFLDAIAFWDATHGIALGDPINGRFMILRTSDGGATWTEIPASAIPAALPGEAAFAASGTSLAVHTQDGTRYAWFATGAGGTARIFRSQDGGATWEVHTLPLAANAPSKGTFSIAFRDALRGVAVGGDYANPDSAAIAAAVTTDGGITWQAAPPSAATGYLSAVTYLATPDALIAVGTQGTALSMNGGRRWRQRDTLALNAVMRAPDSHVLWGVGARGRIVRDSLYIQIVATLNPTPPRAPQTLAPLPPALPRTYTPRPTTAAITVDDLKSRLYPFADDSMLGRSAGELGNVKATDFLAKAAKAIGLQPAGDSGTFFQIIPLKERVIDSTAGLSTDSITFKLGDDYIPLNDIPASLHNTPVVWGGRVGDRNTIAPSAAAGKIVVYGSPKNAEDPAAQRFIPVMTAAAIFLLRLDDLPPAVADYYVKPKVIFTHSERPSWPRSQPTFVYMATAAGERLFPAPLDSLLPGRPGKMVTFTHRITERPAQYPARNVIAVLPGSDSILRNQYVAIGSHSDHVGVASPSRRADHDSLRAYNQTALVNGADTYGRPAPTSAEWERIHTDLATLRALNPPRMDSVFNGADDDGSGSVAMLEIAEQLISLKARPRRSILFVWHTAEEKGLWGSEYFTDVSTVPRDSIVAQLNIDMIGRGEASDIVGGGPKYLQLIGSRRLSSELGDLIENVNTTKRHDFALDYSFDANGHRDQIYCRSDHYNYARYGIPVTFFTTGGHPAYHQLIDEAQYINYEHLRNVTAFISDIALTLANRDTRPTVDKRRPNPRERCVQ